MLSSALETTSAQERASDKGVNRLRYRIALWSFVALILILAAVPVAADNFTFAFYLMLWIAMATGMNICVGFTGYLPFGYVVFYGVGAYATGICYRLVGLPILPSLLVAGVAGLVVAMLM